MFRKLAGVFALLTLVAFSVPQTAQAELVAYWNFNTFDPANDVTLAADSGTGEISLASFGGGLANFAGNTGNSLFGDPAGSSLSLTGGGSSSPFPGNGTSIDISFSMAGMKDLELSYWTRRTGTGFNSNSWAFSTDGVNFTAFESGINPSSSTSGEVLTFSTSALDNINTAFLRYTFDGATSSSGNNRIDNFQLNAAAIPEPGSLALLACIAGGVIYRRRSATR